MQSIFELIYVSGDILATVIHLFILAFCLDFALGFAYILKSAIVSSRA